MEDQERDLERQEEIDQEINEYKFTESTKTTRNDNIYILYVERFIS